MRRAVSCSLSAQADLLDLLEGSRGTPFLFLSSLYCAHGKGGFYAQDSKGHLEFLRCALPAELGVALTCLGVADSGEAVEVLQEVIEQRGPVILPVNLKFYPGYIVQQVEDRAYPLIALEKAADVVVVHDNLRRGRSFESAEGWEGKRSALGVEELSRMMASYEEGGLAVEWMGGAPRYWLLAVQSDDQGWVDGSREVSGWMAHRYRDAVSPEPADAASASVEMRHWDALVRLAHAQAAEAQARVRQYLLEVKLAAFHVDLLLRNVAARAGEARAEEVASLQTKKTSLRTRFLVDALAGRLAACDVDEVRRRLGALDAAVRASLLEKLGELG